MAIIKIPIEFLQDGTMKQYPELYELEMTPIQSLPLPKETPQNNIFEPILSNMIPSEENPTSLQESIPEEEEPLSKKPHVQSFMKTFKNHMKSIRNYTQKRRTGGTSSNGTSSNGAMVVDSTPQSKD